MLAEHQYLLPSQTMTATMTATAFTEAVEAMPSLLPAMVEHLVQMAPDLTDEERAQTIATLQPVSNEIASLEKEQEEIFKDGEKEMKALKKKGLPRVKEALEQSERTNAEGVLDEELTKN